MSVAVLTPQRQWRALPTLPFDATAIALCVVALRIAMIGNPHIHVDEEFYLLVGGRMVHGALPYIDIWDRKPVGLFLIYAFAALFGDGVVAYQILAMLFVFATSMIIYTMARSFADRPSAVLSAVTYVLLLNLFEGMGGQAPVFYNLLVTAAAALLIGLFLSRTTISLHRIAGTGALLMLLMGLAIQIKYSVVGEAICFGLILQWLAWRKRGLAAACGLGIVWAFLALAPTIAAYLFYWRLGAGDLFIYTNFTSTLQRGSDPLIWVVNRLISIVRVLVIPMAIGLWGGAPRQKGEQARHLLDLPELHPDLEWRGLARLPRLWHLFPALCTIAGGTGGTTFQLCERILAARAHPAGGGGITHQPGYGPS